MSSFSWCADVKSFQKLQIWLALIFQWPEFSKYSWWILTWRSLPYESVEVINQIFLVVFYSLEAYYQAWREELKKYDWVP